MYEHEVPADEIEELADLKQQWHMVKKKTFEANDNLQSLTARRCAAPRLLVFHHDESRLRWSTDSVLTTSGIVLTTSHSKRNYKCSQ
jgi:hypothetical protein